MAPKRSRTADAARRAPAPPPRRGDVRARPKSPARPSPFHLFTYGTLTAPAVFRAVLGRRLVHDPARADGVDSFLAREAVLGGYRKISPDNTYLYAVPDPVGHIRGYVVGPLPGECLAALNRYEGRNYRRARLKVTTAEGVVRAVVYVGHQEQLTHAFGWEFRDHLKQEVLLHGQIERVLHEDETLRLHTHEPLARRALSELHALTIRDLVRRHFDAGGISAFAIREAIRGEPLREFGGGARDPAVGAVADNYLAMVVRQVLFNQVEERIHEEFRYELDRMGVSEGAYERTIPALAALRALNRRGGLIGLLVGDVLTELSPETDRLIDYVRWAIRAADLVYEPRRAKAELERIAAGRSGGAVPIGAELEFSNIGHDVIRDLGARRVCDRLYDGFLYFRDFALDVLTWKLGGHVDDHHEKSSARRRRGFFELALGSLSVEAEISKPITSDPWLLNQIVHAAMDFYEIEPHSLHLSFQLRSSRAPVANRALPLGVVKCLFALAGDPVRGPDGRVRIRRLVGDEIARHAEPPYLLFSRASRRRSTAGDDEYAPADRGRWVQQFKFLRLDPRLDYEPIVVALKGLQIHYKPGVFLKADQFASDPALRELFERLTRWGAAVEPLGADEIGQFITGARQGLMREHRGKPAHSRGYIKRCLDRLRDDLKAFNDFVAGRAGGSRPRTGRRSS